MLSKQSKGKRVQGQETQSSVIYTNDTELVVSLFIYVFMYLFLSPEKHCNTLFHAGAEALDECGLRYLLAMRLHTCLLTSLPPLYRMQLLHQGKYT